MALTIISGCCEIVRVVFEGSLRLIKVKIRDIFCWYLLDSIFDLWILHNRDKDVRYQDATLYRGLCRTIRDLDTASSVQNFLESVLQWSRWRNGLNFTCSKIFILLKHFNIPFDWDLIETRFVKGWGSKNEILLLGFEEIHDLCFSLSHGLTSHCLCLWLRGECDIFVANFTFLSLGLQLTQFHYFLLCDFQGKMASKTKEKDKDLSTTSSPSG